MAYLGIDVESSIYEEAHFWVDYYPPQTSTAPEVSAAIYFPDRSPIPIGVLPQEQHSNFLRNRSTTYQVLAGNHIFSDSTTKNYGEARYSAQQRALPLGIAVMTNDSKAAGAAQGTVAFTAPSPLFSARAYFRPVGNNRENLLMAVVHFADAVRSPVAFFVIDKSEFGRGLFMVCVDKDPEAQSLENAGVSQDIERAGYHCGQVIVPIATSLYGLATREMFEGKMAALGMPDYELPGTSNINAQELRLQYHRLLENLRRTVN